MLEGFVVAAALKHFAMEDINEQPTANKPPPLFALLPAEQQYSWLIQQARSKRHSLTQQPPRPNIRNELQAEDAYTEMVEGRKDENDRYCCPDCRKTYILLSALEKHQLKVHDIESTKAR